MLQPVHCVCHHVCSLESSVCIALHFLGSSSPAWWHALQLATRCRHTELARLEMFVALAMFLRHSHYLGSMWVHKMTLTNLTNLACRFDLNGSLISAVSNQQAFVDFQDCQSLPGCGLMFCSGATLSPIAAGHHSRVSQSC